MLIQLFFFVLHYYYSFYFDFYFILMISRSFSISGYCGSVRRRLEIELDPKWLVVFSFFCLVLFSLPKPKCALNIQQAIALQRTYIVHRTPFDIHITKHQTCTILQWFISHTPQRWGWSELDSIDNKNGEHSRVPTKQSTNDPANFSPITKRFCINVHEPGIRKTEMCKNSRMRKENFV